MDAVERQLTLPADVAGAWDLLTRPEDLIAWLGAEVELEPRPGASGLVVDHDGTRRRLVVDEVEAGRRLTWVWGVEDAEGRVGPTSRVELTLAPVEDGTVLTVVERPLEPAAHAEVRASAGGAWSHRLLHLDALLLVAAAVRGG